VRISRPAPVPATKPQPSRHVRSNAALVHVVCSPRHKMPFNSRDDATVQTACRSNDGINICQTLRAMISSAGTAAPNACFICVPHFHQTIPVRLSSVLSPRWAVLAPPAVWPLIDEKTAIWRFFESENG